MLFFILAKETVLKYKCFCNECNNKNKIPSAANAERDFVSKELFKSSWFFCASLLHTAFTTAVTVIVVLRYSRSELQRIYLSFISIEKTRCRSWNPQPVP